jgi:hypothetical protein
MSKFKREYCLQVNFDSDYEVTAAINALELCVPENNSHKVFDPHTLHTAILEIWNGCFRDKEGSVPRIMPVRMENDHETQMWKKISQMLIESGKYIQSYIEDLEKNL